MKASAGNVLMIVQNLPVPFDRRVWLEAQTLRDYGCDVSVICPKSARYHKSFERINDINIYRYKMPVDAHGVLSYFFEFTYAWLMTALLSLFIWFRHGFDVIQACNPPDTYFLLGAFYKLFGKKYVFDHHDLSPEMFTAKYNGSHPRLWRMLLWLEKMTMKTADVVMATNDSYKDVAVQRGGKQARDVFVLRTGPDMQRLRVMPKDKNLLYGKKHMVCYLGEMCPQDGVDYLLRAVEHIYYNRKNRDVQFVVMGGGPAMPEFQKMSQALGLQENVHFTGRVSDETLCRYLSSADVCVAPDPNTEWSNHSTMNKVLEYMAFGKPIVSFDLLETRVSAQHAATYIKSNDTTAFGDAVLDLLAHPYKRECMGRYGYNRIRSQLSWAHTHKALLLAYQNVLPGLMSPEETEHTLTDYILTRIQGLAIDSLLFEHATGAEHDFNPHAEFATWNLEANIG